MHEIRWHGRGGQGAVTSAKILADAAYLILNSDAKTTTGNFFIDDALLAQHGVTFAGIVCHGFSSGTAKFLGATDVAALKVSFFGPFYGGYNVVDLDPDYQHALIAGPDTSYLWILSRTPDPPPAVVERLVAKAASLGYDTGALIFVRH